MHKAYVIIIVVITDIIITNTNISMMKLSVKKFLFTNSISNSSVSCLSFRSKISESWLYWSIYSYNVNGTDSNVLSNMLLLRKTGKVYSEIVLLVSIRASNSSVRLNSFI